MTDVRCPECGEIHPIEEIEGSYLHPDLAASMGRFSRFFRVSNDGNFCIVDRKRHFVRGLLRFPLTGGVDEYCWGVWVEIDRDTYRDMDSCWDSAVRERGPEFHGTLANEIPVFGAPIFGIPVAVTIQPIGHAPYVYIRDTFHPAFLEQANGISLERAMEFNHWVLGLGA